MYICWEHARFSRVAAVVCSSAQGPCREGDHSQDALPTQPPPAQARPSALIFALSSVHALIGLRQPLDRGTLATSCTYDCKMVNVCIISGLVI